MLVTQGALVKTICCVASILVVFNFYCLSLVSEPPQTGIRHSIYRVFHDVAKDWSNLNHPLPNNDLSSHLPDAQKPKLSYMDAPLDRFFSSPNPNRRDYHEWNEKTLRDLHTCMVLEGCGPNQMKVALLADKWMTDAVVSDFRGGEGIWWAITVASHLYLLIDYNDEL